MKPLKLSRPVYRTRGAKPVRGPPILNKTIVPVYLAFTPTSDGCCKGLSQGEGLVISFNFG